MNVAIKAPDRAVNLFIDCEAGSLTFNGLKNFTHSAAMTSLHENLARNFDQSKLKKPCDAEVMLMKAAGFLVNVDDVPKEYEDGFKLPHKNVTCLTPWVPAVANWTDDSGNHSESAIPGETKEGWTCLGHCGPGCSIPFKEYTQACLNHAMCCLNNKFGGCFDGTCGDEWLIAQEDYWFAGFECTSWKPWEHGVGAGKIK